jgi:SAM-dependent methyltransferase
MSEVVYTHGTSNEMLGVMSGRRAAEWLNFLLPYLKPGFNVLDCGCGPGSLTVDVADLVKPGKVVGLDINTDQFEAGRRMAAARGLTNVEFRRGNMAELPFADASLDAVIAITAVQHLPDPLIGLREIRRVLKPGGVVGIKDEDWGSLLWEPATPMLKECAELITRVWERNGGQPFYPRHLRRLLLEAGFVRAEAGAIARAFGTPEGTRWLCEHFLRGHFIEPNFAQTAIGAGWADPMKLAAMQAETERWADRPDAFWSLTFCEAVAWA